MSRAVDDDGILRAATAATPLVSSPFNLAVIHTAQPAARHRRPLPRLSRNLRLILGITLLLLGLGSLSCQVQNSVGDGPVIPWASKWVRTVDGWERTGMWHAPELYVPRLHPLVVAAGQGLVSVMALVICAPHGQLGRRCQQR